MNSMPRSAQYRVVVVRANAFDGEGQLPPDGRQSCALVLPAGEASGHEFQADTTSPCTSLIS